MTRDFVLTSLQQSNTKIWVFFRSAFSSSIDLEKGRHGHDNSSSQSTFSISLSTFSLSIRLMTVPTRTHFERLELYTSPVSSEMCPTTIRLRTLWFATEDGLKVVVRQGTSCVGKPSRVLRSQRSRKRRFPSRSYVCKTRSQPCFFHLTGAKVWKKRRDDRHPVQLRPDSAQGRCTTRIAFYENP